MLSPGAPPSVLADEPRALDGLLERLPEVAADLRSQLSRRVARRWHDYPFGSGQGDEIALRAGLRPMLRELLPTARVEAAIARYRGLGLEAEPAAQIYGATRDGWLRDPEPAESPDARTPLYVGRDRDALREAAALEVLRNDEASTALGRLLGYPRCCVTAFVETSRERRAPELIAAALARTDGAPLPRLNGLDYGIFHFLPWAPCTFRCSHSARYADALAERVARAHPTFVAAIDRALRQHRLMLTHEVQLSLSGRWDGRVVHVERIEPTASDRHPGSVLTEPETQAVVGALAWLEGARTVGVSGRALVVDGVERPLGVPAPLPLLVPFG